MELSLKFSSVLALIFLAAGCAHSQKKLTPEPAAAASVAASTETDTAVSPPKRMPLPYTFFRRGVKIRANSVEFSKDKFLVSVTVEETRGEPGFVRASTLMEARMAESKTVLPYTGYLRDAQLQTEPGITLSANQKLTLDLVFQLPADTNGSGTPVELQFTTGKWWSSQP